MRGKSQHDLGDAVECRFQQIQKYETGMNRVSASRLWDIAKRSTCPSPTSSRARNSRA
ncbi:helix-turn-helix domain-containing protein [Limimaricola cinnabarinus]